MEYHIDDLPDEILEYILDLIPPYKCLRECLLVCKRWSHAVKRVIEHKETYFQKSVALGSLQWNKLMLDTLPAVLISNRHSHSACTYENCMYVFGGCTGTSTTFNDLWKFDLDTRKWERPMPTGNYPSPKACATMVYYKQSFILFGGWSNPSTYPPHQRKKLFKELHVYCIKTNRWSVINTLGGPPATSAHSASIHGNLMVVFGGVSSNYSSSNDVWCLDLDTFSWQIQATSDPKPHPRYGHSQIELNEKNLLILGGCTGPNAAMNDAWLLTMEGPVWRWKNVIMNGTEYAPTRIWCHQACKVGNHVIVLGERKQSTRPKDMSITGKISCQPSAPARSNPPIHSPRQRPESKIDRDENVNGRHGRFSSKNAPSPDRPLSLEELPGVVVNIELKWYGILGNDHTSEHRHKNRQRQLESLRRMEEKIQSRNNRHRLLRRRRDRFSIFALDITDIIEEESTATWIYQPEEARTGPEVRILYSLVLGKGELIVFGGIRKELTTLQGQADEDGSEVYNEVLFINPPQYTI